MKKGLILIFALILGMGAWAQDYFHDFVVKDINGDDFAFSQLKGKKVLVINVASKCGFTYQYEAMQKLYAEYGGDDFVIVGFPANNFREQEPGTNKEIKEFCKKNYGVTFPMMSKISVKGDNMHPVYQWLTQKKKNGVGDSEVNWNFQKYLINADGTLHNVIGTRTEPNAEEIIEWIKG